MAEQPGMPQGRADSATAQIAPTLSRFAHLGARVTPPAPAELPPASALMRSAPEHAPAAEKRPSIWRRIALARGPNEGPSTEALNSALERVQRLENQITTQHASTDERLARCESAVHEIWDRERQVSLAQLRERLAGLETDQAAAEEALRRAHRGLRWLGALLTLTAGCGIAAGWLLL